MWPYSRSHEPYEVLFLAVASPLGHIHWQFWNVWLPGSCKCGSYTHPRKLDIVEQVVQEGRREPLRNPGQSYSQV